jgi:thiol-disulfide isomerase/thioredoxin
MSRWINSLALGLAAAATFGAPASGAAQQPRPLPEFFLIKNPAPAPALTVTTLDGRRMSLASLRGKVVLLNFWATWCGPCRMEIPEFEQLQRKYAGKIQVVGLSVDELPPAAVHQAAVKLKINYPVAIASNALQTRFGPISTIPVTWVIDREGRVVQINHGANPYQIFDTEIRATLGLPTAVKVAYIDRSALRKAQLSPWGQVGTLAIPGVAAALRALTPAQRQRALAALNQVACTCGCQWSLATCRTQDPSCGFSLPQARQLIAAIKAGKK